MTDGRPRCAWANSDPLNRSYHDTEWGVPVREASRLFEMITLEGAQAGLSWLTILKKRQGYRDACADFDPVRVAGCNQRDIERRLQNPGIVRHRGKIESTINNARCFLNLKNQGQGFPQLAWNAVGGSTRVNRWRSLAEIPGFTAESVKLSKRLKKLGFRFVGPTTCYAFMQAAGLVNDHEISCFRYAECQSAVSSSSS